MLEPTLSRCRRTRSHSQRLQLPLQVVFFLLLVRGWGQEQVWAEDATPRYLAASTWLPNRTILTLESAPYLSEGRLAIDVLQSPEDYPEHAAGIIRDGLSLSGPDADWPPGNQQKSRVRFIFNGIGGATTNAACGEAYSLDGDMIGGPDFSHGGGPNITISRGPTGWNGLIQAPLMFRKGGVFRLCFSDDGSFMAPNHSQLLDIQFDVKGLTDACKQDDCLATKPGFCSFYDEHYSLSGLTGCALRYSGMEGESFSATWTAKYVATYTAGQERVVSAPLCGTGPPEPNVFDNSSLYGRGMGEVQLDMVPSKSRPREPVTVAVCYCPGISNRACNSLSFFSQQVGLVHIFTAAMCDPSEGTSCTSKYYSVSAGQRFLLKVFCPPLGCPANSESRVKLVLSSLSNFRPSWDESNGCRSALHLDEWVPRSNCKNSTDCSLSGGIQQDYKVWGSKSTIGLWAWDSLGKLGAERPDLRGHINDIQIDVCFCNADCFGSASAWFRADTIRVAPIRLAVPTSSSGILSFTNVKGGIGFRMYPGSSGTVLGPKAGSVIKLLSDPWLNATADECNAAAYGDNSNVIVVGLGSMSDARDRSGFVRGSDKLIFDGGTESRGFLVNRPGVLAVCYCALLQNDVCASGGFVVGARLTVRGADSGHSWVVSTGGLFQISYVGNGLEKTDTVRISDLPCAQPPSFSTRIGTGCPFSCTVSAAVHVSTIVTTQGTVECDDLGENCQYVPIDAVTPGTNLTELTFRSDPFLDYGDDIVIEPNVLGKGVQGGTEGQLEALRGRFQYATTPKSAQELEQRRQVWLNSLQPGDKVEVRLGIAVGGVKWTGYWSNATLEVYFTETPQKCEGWELVGLSQNHPFKRICKNCEKMSPSVCTGESWASEDWSLLREPAATQDYYSVPHKVLDGENLFKRNIKLSFGGDADPLPTFEIALPFEKLPVNPLWETIQPPFEDVMWSGGIDWTRHNRAYTKREMVLVNNGGNLPQQPLHVCWSPGLPHGYIVEMGTLSFETPPPMLQAHLTLVAPIINADIPAILAFETGSRLYPNADGGTALVLRFVNTQLVQPMTSSGQVAGPGISRAVATQGMCGQILLEAWSSRSDLGFPLPKSCRFSPPYNVPQASTVQEVEIEFEALNGLIANTKYQLVLNVNLPSATAQGQTAVEVLALDDLRTRPNSAIEAMQAQLSVAGDVPLGNRRVISEAEVPGFMPAGGVQHNSPAGTFEMATLSGTNSLNLKLRVGNWNTIVSGSRTRILMWPLLQWELSDNLQFGGCSTNAYVQFDCSGTVRTEAVDSSVRGQKNTIAVTGLSISSSPISSAGTPATTPTPVLELSNAGLVVGGFFLARPAVVYTESSTLPSTYFHPDIGAAWYRPSTTFGMLVSSRGDGNSDPFIGKVNLLYARLLFSVGLPTSTSVTIESPQFYSHCENADVLPNLGHWRPIPVPLNTTLPPWGTGALRMSKWTLTTSDATPGCSWKYEVSQSDPSGVHAGSSAFVQLNVSNPISRAFSTSDPENVWRLTLRNTYLNLVMTAVFQVPSQLNNQPYATNVAIMKVIPYVTMSPSVLTQSAQQTVWIFFTLQQQVSPSGQIEVGAPFAYDFANPCNVKELEMPYYRYGGGGAGAILERLPSTSGCVGEEWPPKSSTYTIARVTIGKPLYPGLRYTFGLSVKNAPSAKPHEQILWSLRTLSADGSGIDGSSGCITPSGLPNGACTEVWGLHAEPLLGLTALFGRQLPWFYTRTASYVSLFPISVSRDITAPMRVVSPSGFVWQDMRAFWRNKVSGATGVFPGEFPRIYDTQLFWDTPLDFQTSLTYGFRMPLNIPLWTVNLNVFYIEIGYRGLDYSSETRPYAGYANGTTGISVVRDVFADYLTSRMGATNMVTMRFTTLTGLFPGEGFVFKGYEATDKLRQIDCECPSSEHLPSMSCSVGRDELTFEVIIRIVAESAVSEGSKTFPLKCQNPSLDVPPSDWSLGSYASPGDYPNTPPIDGYGIVTGFGTKHPMRSLIRHQTPAALKESRPLLVGSTILSFQLDTSYAWTLPSVARLRAPEGTFFAIHCHSEFVTAATLINNGGPLPGGTSALPDLLMCQGVNHVAHMNWTSTLQRGVSYVFRVTPKNPPFTPTGGMNVWTLEVDGQASLLALAANITAFVNATVTYSSYGQRVNNGVLGDARCNILRLQFVPSLAARKLQVLAPVGYDFGNQNTCTGLNLQITHQPYPVVITDIPKFPLIQSCRVAANTLQLEFINPLVGGVEKQYVIEISMLNPVAAQSTSNAKYTVQSFLGANYSSQYGDEVTIPSPAIYPNAATLDVLNLLGLLNSGEIVATSVRVNFGRTIGANERIVIDIPKTFMLESAQTYTEVVSKCDEDVEWTTTDGTGKTYLPPTLVSCRCSLVACKIIYAVPQPETIIVAQPTVMAPWDKELTFSIKVKNPISVLADFDNVWTVSLFPAVGADNSDQPLISATHAGWRITPTLGQVLIGFADASVRRAGAIGSLRISFYPPNEASRLRLTALEPSGWSFLGSEVCVSTVSTCVNASTNTSSNVLDVQGISIRSRVPFECVVSRVRFADIGGASSFIVETLTQDQGGLWKPLDKKGPFAGITMPGAINAFFGLLGTKHYVVDNPDDPFWAMVPPRVGESEAIVSFRFTLTRDVAANDYMSVISNSAALDSSTAYIDVRQEGEPIAIPFDVERISLKELKLTFKQSLQAASKTFRAHISMLPIQIMHGAVGHASFINVSIYRPGEDLPVATNDATVENALTANIWSTSRKLMPFSLRGLGASPTSESEVTGVIKAAGVFLAAPPNMTIMSPCTPSKCAEVISNINGTGRNCAVNLVASDGQYSLRVILPQIYFKGRKDWVAYEPGPTGGVAQANMWEMVPGYVLQPMIATVSYAAVADLADVQLIVTFTPSAAAKLLIGEGNSSVEVHVPTGYSVQCGSLFKMLTDLNTSYITCEEPSSTNGNHSKVVLRLMGADYFAADEISVALGLMVASETPQDNRFGVSLQNSQNTPVDANFGIAGKIIPSATVRANISWPVEDLPSQAWMEAWVEAANSSGCFGDGIASALQVPSEMVAIIDIVLNLKEMRRRLAVSASGIVPRVRGDITITFAVSLRKSPTDANYLTTVMARFASSNFTTDLRLQIQRFLGYQGLVDLTANMTVTEPVEYAAPRITDFALSWTASGAHQLAKISLSMTFKQQLVDVRGVLIALPDGFHCEIKKLDDIRVASNWPRFPVLQTGTSWLTVKDPQTIIVKASGAPVQVGSYSFQLPVRIPNKTSNSNFWHLCLCSSSDCDIPAHHTVIVCFVTVGFELDAPLPASSNRMWTDSAESYDVIVPILCLLVCVLRQFLLLRRW